jgi:hypothetical protein
LANLAAGHFYKSKAIDADRPDSSFSTEDEVENEKRRRIQLSKEQKRVLAEQSSVTAFADEDRRRREMAEKSEKLRALRLAKESTSEEQPR